MEVEKENTQEELQSKKKSLIKKFFKILMYIVLSLIGLNILLYVLLSIPFVQQKVANYAVDILKNTLKTEVSIDEVRLSLFNHATLNGIYRRSGKRHFALCQTFGCKAKSVAIN